MRLLRQSATEAPGVASPPGPCLRWEFRMQDEVTPTDDRADVESVPPKRAADFRSSLRAQALQSAMRKRTAGVPTYTVPEAAALLSVSQEYLYRLIQAAAFPAVRMRSGGSQGRYVVPAKAIERLLDEATADSSYVESAGWSDRWQEAGTAGSPAGVGALPPQGGGPR